MVRVFIRIFVMFALLFAGQATWATDKAARQSANKYASIIIDADTLEILHARKIDGARYPASLTKMMTLYLTFDALERGELSLHEPMPVSARAARTPPVRLGLRAGRTITVEQAIKALTVRSANDAAVVLAERIGGSQSEFSYAMTLKAKSLGMRSTVFKNPHGLPNQDQTTTARDMAKLADALLKNHRKYYPYFSLASFTYQGRAYKNHNKLLGKIEGVDGFKTGFTNASGYNLVLSAQRDGHRIIAVVLGGASGASRDQHMADLLERGFDVIKRNQKRNQDTHQKFALKADENKTVRKVLPVPTPKAYTLRASHGKTVQIVQGRKNIIPTQHNGWAIQIGAYGQVIQAQNAMQIARTDSQLNIANTVPKIIPVQRANGVLYRARLGGLTHDSARNVCKILAARGQSCLVVSPS